MESDIFPWLLDEMDMFCYKHPSFLGRTQSVWLRNRNSFVVKSKSLASNNEFSKYVHLLCPV